MMNDIKSYCAPRKWNKCSSVWMILIVAKRKNSFIAKITLAKMLFLVETRISRHLHGISITCELNLNSSSSWDVEVVFLHLFFAIFFITLLVSLQFRTTWVQTVNEEHFIEFLKHWFLFLIISSHIYQFLLKSNHANHHYVNSLIFILIHELFFGLH